MKQHPTTNTEYAAITHFKALVLSAFLLILFAPLHAGANQTKLTITQTIQSIAKNSQALHSEYQNVTYENRPQLLRKLNNRNIEYLLKYQQTDSIQAKVQQALARIRYYQGIDDIRIVEVTHSGLSEGTRKIMLQSDNSLIRFASLLQGKNVKEELTLLLATLKQSKESGAHSLNQPSIHNQTRIQRSNNPEPQSQELLDWIEWEYAWLDGGGFSWGVVEQFGDGLWCGYYEDYNGDYNFGHCGYF